MPLGDSTCIVYSAPIFTAIFAWLLLDEELRWHFYVCLVLAVMGLWLIIQPNASRSVSKGDASRSTSDYTFGAMSALASAIFGGFQPIVVQWSRDCHWATVEHTTSLANNFILNPLALGVWYSFNSGHSGSASDSLHIGSHWPILVVAAMVEFAGLAFQTYGYQRALPGSASLMAFLEIPYSYLIQLTFFRQPPDFFAFVGMMMILTSGILNVICAPGNKVAYPTATSVSVASSSALLS